MCNLGSLWPANYTAVFESGCSTLPLFIRQMLLSKVTYKQGSVQTFQNNSQLYMTAADIWRDGCWSRLMFYFSEKEQNVEPVGGRQTPGPELESEMVERGSRGVFKRVWNSELVSKPRCIIKTLWTCIWGNVLFVCLKYFFSRSDGQITQVGRLVTCFVGRLVDWTVGWLVGWLIGLVGCLFGQLNGLVGCFGPSVTAMFRSAQPKEENQPGWTTQVMFGLVWMQQILMW